MLNRLAKLASHRFSALRRRVVPQKKPGYDACAVANYFLGMYQAKDLSVTEMHLFMLVYIAHGWHLALYDRPLIRDHAEAWTYGPVIPSISDAFRNQREDVKTACRTADKAEFTDSDKELFKQVFHHYGYKSLKELRGILRLDGTPWARMHPYGPFPTIPDGLIHQYYSALRESGETEIGFHFRHYRNAISHDPAQPA